MAYHIKRIDTDNSVHILGFTFYNLACANNKLRELKTYMNKNYVKDYKIIGNYELPKQCKECKIFAYCHNAEKIICEMENFKYMV